MNDSGGMLGTFDDVLDGRKSADPALTESIYSVLAGYEEAMRLVGREGEELHLEVLGYQFPEIEGYFSPKSWDAFVFGAW